MDLPDILSRIVASKREELVPLKPRMAELERRAADQIGRQRGFSSSLRIRSVISPAIIAEIKYDATKNVALQLPLTLVAGDALASSITPCPTPNSTPASMAS